MIANIESYLHDNIELLNNLEIKKLQKLINILRKQQGVIYTCGNGGSAATALHFVTDLKLNAKYRKAVCLNANQSLLTALSNDIDFDAVFQSQLEDIFTAKDTLIVISASGNSKNLINAVKYAHSQGGYTIGILGFDGGELLNLCDFSLFFRTAKGEYELVENIHLIALHIVACMLGK